MTEHAGSAVAPVSIELPRDLGGHADASTEIWYVMGKVQGGGRELAVQLMASAVPGRFITVWVSVTEEATGLNRHDRFRFRFGEDELTLADDRLHIETPAMSLTGDIDELVAAGTIEGVRVDLVLRRRQPVLYNGGTAFFPHFGNTTYQFSLPCLDVSGAITIDGEQVDVSGGGWFDRQWTHARETFASTNHFTWLGLCLDDGTGLSVWDTAVGDQDGHTWATVVRPDGTHTVVAVESLDANGSGAYERPSGKTYPSAWSIRMPGIGGALKVRERQHYDDPLFYTGICEVIGTLAGQTTSGYGFVDMVRG